MRLIHLAVAVPLSLSTSPATADSDTGFVTLDRGDAVSRVGVEISYVRLRDIERDLPRDGFRFETYGQMVNAPTGLGVYEMIPIAVVSVSSTEASLGDIELGGLYVRQLRPQISLVARAGVTLPSTDTSGDIEPARLALQSRPVDEILGLLDAVALRFSASVLYQGDRVFARADVGIDETIESRGRTFVRLDAGVGLDLGNAMFGVELTDLVDPPDGSESPYIAAISARVRAAGARPYAALVIPLDADARRTTSGSLTIGVDVRLP